MDELLYNNCFNCLLAVTGHWLDLYNDSMRTSYTHTGMSLNIGARYSLRVGAINRAGFVAAFETDGIIVDTTAPTVSFVFLGL